MSRSHQTAKDEGTRFETHVRDYLAWALNDERIMRAPKHGTRDQGDIANIYFMGERVCVECKNTKSANYKKHMREAEVEAGNMDAPYFWVVQKTDGVGYKRFSAQLAYTTAEVLQAMRESAPDDEILHDESSFFTLKRYPFVFTTLETFALILNHGEKLGSEVFDE